MSNEDETLLEKLNTESGIESENNSEMGNIFSYQQNAIDQTTEQQGERSKISQYNLRDRPKKSFKASQIKIVKGILLSKNVTNHPTIDDLILLDKAQVRAIKKPIIHHKNQNLKDFHIKNYNLEEKINFDFKNSLSNLLSSYDQWLPVKKKWKSVSFKQIDTVHEVQIKKLNLTFTGNELDDLNQLM